MPVTEYPCPNCNEPVYYGTLECSHCGQSMVEYVDNQIAAATIAAAPAVPQKRRYVLDIVLWHISVVINGLVVFWFLVMALAGTATSGSASDYREILTGTIVFSGLPLIASLVLIGTKKFRWAPPLIPFLALPCIFIGFKALGY